MTIQEIHNAQKAKPASALPDDQRRAAVEAMVKRLYAMKGYLINEHTDEEISILTREIDDKLTWRYSYLRIPETMLALEAGITGEYGKSTNLTVANCLGWLSCYVSSDVYKEARTYVPKPKMDPAALLPRQDIAELNDRAMRKGLAETWERYKATDQLGIILDGYAAAMADWLIARGKIKPKSETFERVVRHHARRAEDVGTIISNGLTNASWAVKRELLTLYFASLKSRGAELAL